MGVGLKIKKLRELRNFSQEFMANSLGLSQTGYGKIERDLTDLSINRLQQIAKVLDVDYKQILEFDEKNIFKLAHNNTANAIEHNQQYINDNRIFEKLEEIKVELESLKIHVDK